MHLSQNLFITLHSLITVVFYITLGSFKGILFTEGYGRSEVPPPEWANLFVRQLR